MNWRNENIDKEAFIEIQPCHNHTRNIIPKYIT